MWTVDWPVATPIITAAAVAVWTRINALYDRRIDTRERERDYGRLLEQQVHASKQARYREITEAVIKLVVDGDMYQAEFDAADVPPTPDQRQSLQMRAASFAASHTAVSLFAEPLANAATMFYNACQEIVSDIAAPAGNRDHLNDQFVNAKLALTVAARQCLQGKLDFI